MEFRAVVSSNIRGAAYDDTEGAMYVEFTSGSRYKYLDVPKEEYEALLGATSAGRFFNDNIKDQYVTQRV